MSAASAPGQGRLPYRAGTHASFHGSMVDALGRIPDLAGLRTRDADDPVVALCDAWASALDVLTFLTERTANEGFLRTAAERRSLLHLARGIGYELRPGVAADTHLAFTVIATPGTPPSFPIPPGTRAQSVPGPGELPQTFETVEPIAEARPEWNAAPVRAAARRTPVGGDSALRLAHTDLALNPGDALLIISPTWFDLRRVEDVEVVPAVVASTVDLREVIAAHTLVRLDAAIVEQPFDGLGVDGASDDPDLVQVHLMRQRCAVFGYNAVDFDELPLATRIGEIHPGILSLGTQSFSNRSMQITHPGVLESDDLHPVVAHDQIQYMTEADGFITGLYALRRPTWADSPFPAGTTTVFLDQSYTNIIAGSWVVLERSGAIVARRVSAVAEVPKRDFGMSARVTRLTLSGQVGGFGPRTTTVLAASRRLRLAPSALSAEVGGGGAAATDTVELAFDWQATEKPLAVGRTVVLSGLGFDGFPAGEVAVIRAVLPPVGAGPRLQMTASLTGSYQRTTLRVMGNAARATHGESRAEVLGSGDQRIAFPSFTVRQAPTTHTRAPTSSGTATTMAIWVQGVRWREVDSFYGCGPTDPVYVTRRADDASVRVTFGDGRTGARLPTGRDNVVATLRTGIGREANLGIGRISIPLSRPLGLRDVTNPVTASGADDPETIEVARRTAPLPVTTIGRIVSIADYANFASAYAGVGKARSDFVWDGERNVIAVTIAGADGAPVGEGDPLIGALVDAIDAARHPTLPVKVIAFQPLQIRLTAGLVVAADRRFVDVAAAATASLIAAFSFEAMSFARSVPSSDVFDVLHEVPGVAGVLLSSFHEAGAAVQRRDSIVARTARRVDGVIRGAQIITVDAGGAGISFTQAVQS